MKIDDILAAFLRGGESIDLSAMLKQGIVANLGGLPAFHPLRDAADGFPIGLQLSGRSWQRHLLPP